MPYCTRQQMIDRFGEPELIQLTDNGPIAQGVIDDTVLNGAIDDASAEVDGYLAGRYDLPLSVVPTVLTRIACDITRYYLYDDAVPDRVEKRYDDAVKFLRSVGKGEISLGVDSGGAEAQPADMAEMQTGGRIFGRDDNGFV